MKICAMSDLHGRLPGVPPFVGLKMIPECDVLLIAGDFCADFTRMWDPDIMRMRQMDWLATEFAAWEQQVPAEHILITPGNHDWVNSLPANCRSRLLIDAGCEIRGVKFYFTPWVPPIMSWNWMATRENRKAAFSDIPSGLDVLVSHAPAANVLDQAYDGEHCGCPELRQAIYRTKPKFMVHGHIHEGQRNGNHAKLGSTDVYNVAMFKEKDWMPVILNIDSQGDDR